MYNIISTNIISILQKLSIDHMDGNWNKQAQGNEDQFSISS